jgi:hypothetical protein
MTLPVPGFAEEDPAVTASTGYLVFDIDCLKCKESLGNVGSTRRVPRFGRFIRRTEGGPVGVQKFTVDDQTVIPYCHVRKDGGRTWYMVCPQEHEKRIPEEQIALALDTIVPDVDGNGSARVSL